MTLLPRHVVKLGTTKLPEPRPSHWRIVGQYGRSPSAVMEVNYDHELPPWNAGPYKQDVPKR